MKATLTTRKPKYTSSHRRESRFTAEYAMVVPSDTSKGYALNRTVAIATLRIYATDAMTTAAVWINSGDSHTSGTGKAGGGGYHRASAAAAEAISNAGFDLSEAIDGRGDGAIESAMIAIAYALGHHEALLHVAHG